MIENQFVPPPRLSVNNLLGFQKDIFTQVFSDNDSHSQNFSKSFRIANSLKNNLINNSFPKEDSSSFSSYIEEIKDSVQKYFQFQNTINEKENIEGDKKKDNKFVEFDTESQYLLINAPILCTQQYFCRILQSKLDNCSNEFKRLLFNEVKNE